MFHSKGGPQGAAKFPEELQKAVERKDGRLFTKEAVNYAAKHGIASIHAVVQALRGDYDRITSYSPDKLYLHRNCEAQFLDHQNQRVANNPMAEATVQKRDLELHVHHNVNPGMFDDHHLDHPLKYKFLNNPGAEDIVRDSALPRNTFEPRLKRGTIDAGMGASLDRTGSSLPHGGLNFIVGGSRRFPFTPYVRRGTEAGGHVNIRCTLADVLAQGGRIYFDSGAAVRNAVLVELPHGKSLPFERAT